MPAISGVGERLALVAGGAVVLALAQLIQAKQKGKSTGSNNERTGGAHSVGNTEVCTNSVLETFGTTAVLRHISFINWHCEGRQCDVVGHFDFARVACEYL